MKSLALFFLLVYVGTAAAQSKIVPCDDRGGWESLEGLRAKYKGTSGENDVEYLYRLRIFVCEEVKAGRLPYEAATPLFDGEKKRIVKEWAESGAKKDVY